MFRLLIVDDEPYIVEGLAEMLMTRDLPFKDIKKAYSSAEALEMFEQLAFDIVIADIRMPEMDGLALLEKVKAYWSYTKFIYLTGYSDFEYVQKAMKLGASDYLLKPVEDSEIIQCVNKVIEELERNLDQMITVEQVKKQAAQALPAMQRELFQFILDSSERLNIQELESRFKALKFPFDPRKQTAVIVFKIDEWEERFDPEDEPLVQFAVQNVVGEILERNCILQSIRNNEGIIAILLQPVEDMGIEHITFVLKERLVEAQDAIQRNLGVVASFAFSPYFIQWGELSSVFVNLVARLKQSFTKGLLISSMEDSGNANSGHIQKQLSIIRNAIQSKDFDAFRKSLDETFDGASDSAPGRRGYIACMFTHISSYILELALQYNFVSILEPSDLEKLSNLYAHKTTGSIKTLYISVFQKVTNASNILNSKPMETVIKHLKEYIGEHLNDSLSLDELAKKVYMNPSYLSKMFHQVHGEQLNAYITAKKMEYARMLLLNSDLKIQQISEKIAFLNPNYFAKVFKKTYGVSPHDFRIYNAL